jgi:hypothetical protein
MAADEGKYRLIDAAPPREGHFTEAIPRRSGYLQLAEGRFAHNSASSVMIAENLRLGEALEHRVILPS